MSNLWNGKAVTIRECERKAYWAYWLGLDPIGGKANMERGAYIHDVISNTHKMRLRGNSDMQNNFGTCLAMAKGVPEYEHMDEDNNINLMMGNAWALMKDQNIIAPEKVVHWKDYAPGVNWKGKPDGIIHDTRGFWIAELKTTLRYGDSLRRLYYKEIQPWLYYMIVKTQYPEYSPLLGVRMFIAPPKGGIPIEDIPFTSEREDIVMEFMRYMTLTFMRWEGSIYAGQIPEKDRSKCTNLFGECQYYALCVKGAFERKDYFEMLCKSFYKKVDPEDHLKEDVEDGEKV